MAGIRSISIFQRSPAWPTNKLGVPKGAYSRPCTCQLSRSPKPMPESPASTDPSLESSNLINVVSLPRAADRKYSARTLEELVESIQTVLRRSSDPASTLNLIDTVQRLGISQLKFGATKLYKLKFGAKVQIVLQDTSIVSVEDHPMHLHGYHYAVIGSGFGNFNPRTDPAKFNLIDPPYRNTIGTPPGGWVAIRFEADNPGIWFMHCHLDSHRNWGLAMSFLVDNVT